MDRVAARADLTARAWRVSDRLRRLADRFDAFHDLPADQLSTEVLAAVAEVEKLTDAGSGLEGLCRAADRVARAEAVATS